MQGFHQAVYACAARDIHTVYVFNHSDRDLTDYLERLKKAIDKEDVKVVQCKAVEELVRNSDIICTTTPSTTPVLPDDKRTSEREMHHCNRLLYAGDEGNPGCSTGFGGQCIH